MVRSTRFVATLAGALLVGTVLAPPAAASTITLTGGDAGEGYAPLGTTFAAVNVGAASPFVVQGVNFAVSHPNIAISAVSTTNQNVASLGASADDLNLLSVVQSSVGESGPITVTISGLSKAYMVTGWRIGFVHGPAEFTRRLRKMHDYVTLGAPAPLQVAAVTALNLPLAYYDTLRDAYQARRDLLRGHIPTPFLRQPRC